MAKYADYEDQIDYLIELARVYDGWSIAVLKDGTWVNRWENDEGTGPEPGYERRWAAARDAIAAEGLTIPSLPETGSKSGEPLPNVIEEDT